MHPLEPRGGVDLGQISNANGTSTTALLSHLGVNPLEYAYGPTTWYNCNNATGGTSVPDSQAPLGAYLTPNSYNPPDLSSPHPGVNLVTLRGRPRPVGLPRLAHAESKSGVVLDKHDPDFAALKGQRRVQRAVLQRSTAATWRRPLDASRPWRCQAPGVP